MAHGISAEQRHEVPLCRVSSELVSQSSAEALQPRAVEGNDSSEMCALMVSGGRSFGLNPL